MAITPVFGHLLDDTPTAREMQAIAQLIYQSFDDFYDYLPLPSQTVHEVIAKQAQDPRSECFNPLTARIDGQIVGIICSFPSDELAARQRASTLDFIRLLDRDGRQSFKQAMSDGNHSAAPLPSADGVYISRVAIVDDVRGQGLGKAMLQQFMALHAGQRITLHVDQSNTAAQRIYASAGFHTVQTPQFRKFVMYHD